MPVTWVLHSQANADPAVDSTLQYHNRRLRIAKERSDAYQIAVGHMHLGEFYYGSGLFSQAISQYDLGLGQLGKNKDTLYARLNMDIGKVYLSRNSFNVAAQYFEEATKVYDEIGNGKGFATALGLWGNCYEKLGAYSLALEKQKSSLTIFRELEVPFGMALANENLGSIYEDLENFKLAFNHFRRAYALIKGTGSLEEVVILNNLGDVHRKTGDFSNALLFTQKALSLAQELNDAHQIKSAHRDMAKTYALRSEFKKAYWHLEQYDIHNEKWISAQNSRQLNVLQSVNETNRKQAQIELLQEQNKVHSANQRLLWIAFLFSLVLLLVGYLFLDRKRKSRQKLQEYEQRELKLQLEKKATAEQNLQREIQLKATALSRYSLHLSQKNTVLLHVSNTLLKLAGRKNMDMGKKLEQLSGEIDLNLKQEGEWEEFQNYFREIHPEFMTNLLDLAGNGLSSAELRLAMLLRLNLSSREIATITKVTPDSVRVARYRLRKKLPIGSKTDLVHFLMEL
tara:strand:+ start:124235 stop:125770 length:1536 start_codon:yes stop_codon:yes gene_type:complete